MPHTPAHGTAGTGVDVPGKGFSPASYNGALVDTKPAVSTPSPGSAGPERPGVDVRASRVYLFSRRPLDRRSCAARPASPSSSRWTSSASRSASTWRSCFRTVLYGDTVYWSLLWREGPREWLPFLAPVTVLVFLQAGLYARRERRAGAGRVVSSLVLVALIILSIGIGTELRLHDDRAHSHRGRHVLARDRPPPRRVLVVRARADEGGRRASQGRARRARDRSLEHLAGELAPRRASSSYDFVGAVAVGEVGSLPVLGSSLAEIPAILERARPDELILSEADFDERTVLEVVERAHAAGRQGPARAEDDGAARAEGRVRARRRRAPLRPAPADPHGLGLAREADLRPRYERADRRRRAAALAARRARDQARLARARCSTSTAASAWASASSGC